MKNKYGGDHLFMRMIVGRLRMAGVVVIVGPVLAGVVMPVNMFVGPVVVMVRVLVVMPMAVGMGVFVAVNLSFVLVFVDVGVIVFVIMLVLMGVFAFHDAFLLAVRVTASTSSTDRHPGGSRDLFLRAVQRIPHPCGDDVALP